MSYNRKQQVTVDLFSLVHTPHLFIEVTGRMYMLKAPGLAKSEDGTIPVLPVINLETGEAGALILPTMLVRVFDEAGAIEGKKYELQDRGVLDGKDYRAVRVWEID